MNAAESMQWAWLNSHSTSLSEKYDGRVPDDPIVTVNQGRAGIIPVKRRGRRPVDIPVEEELDLHGMTIDQGLLELENFIRLCGEYKIKSIRVIHGMGPEKGPSLRRAVRRFLKTRGRAWISGCAVENHNSGCIIVYPR